MTKSIQPFFASCCPTLRSATTSKLLLDILPGVLALLNTVGYIIGTKAILLVVVLSATIISWYLF